MKNIINESIDYSSGDELVKLIESELKLVRCRMRAEKLKKSLVDKYSHMAWAIENFLFNLYDCSNHMDISVIRTLIMIHADEYAKYIDNASEDHDVSLYKDALEAIQALDLISRAFK